MIKRLFGLVFRAGIRKTGSRDTSTPLEELAVKDSMNAINKAQVSDLPANLTPRGSGREFSFSKRHERETERQRLRENEREKVYISDYFLMEWLIISCCTVEPSGRWFVVALLLAYVCPVRSVPPLRWPDLHLTPST